MFKGNWYERSAVVALVIVLAAVALLSASLLSYEKGRQEQTTQYHASHYAEQPPEKIEEYCGALATPADAARCAIERSDSNRDAKRAEQDLGAQQEMAKWAYWLTWLTFSQMILGVVGAGAIIWTLYETRRTAIAAIEQSEISKRAQRAWIDVDLEVNGMKWSQDETLLVDVNAVITNYGATLAKHVHTNMTEAYSATLVDEPLRVFASKSRVEMPEYSRNLAPNCSYRRRWVLDFEKTEISKSATMGRWFFPVIIGCVTYETISDDELHQTTFAFYLKQESTGAVDIAIEIGGQIPERIDVVHAAAGISD